MNRFALALAALVAFTGTAKAADFSVYRNNDSYVYIDVRGEIAPTDGLVLAAAAAKLKGMKVVVNLDSPGGNVIGGLGMAGTIRSNGWSTFVGDTAMCASACADVWLAGVNRYAYETSKIGMHSASLNGVRSDEGNRPRIAFYIAIGLSKDAVVAMLSPSPTSMMWLTPAKAAEIGITYNKI